MGRALVWLQWLLPQQLLGRLAGRLAGSRTAWVKRALIGAFCRCYAVDLGEAARPRQADYASFNDFFTRELKPGARPVQGKVCSPADGTVAALGRVAGDASIIAAKGQGYSLPALLGEADASRFAGGSFITLYLAPHQYHRFHLPCAAELRRTRYLPGALFSVNPATVRHRRGLFARNERLVAHFACAQGELAYVMVGALLVAGIKPVWRAAPYPPGRECRETLKRRFAQGEELGQFQMGSTVVLVFERALDFAVRAGQAVKMGQALVR